MKKFFKGCAIGCAGMVAGILLMLILPFVLLSSLIESFEQELVAQTTPATLEPGTVLVVDISRGFSDASLYSAANAGTLFSEGVGAYCTREVIDALRAAAFDENISAILLTGSDCGASLATINELSIVINEIKSANQKPIYAYLSAPTQNDYLLVANATKIFMNSAADLPFAGTATTRIYLKNALEKLGIGVQVTKVGKYKSAVEPFIAETISDADRAQTEIILNDRWNYFLNAAGTRANLPREQLLQLAANEPIISAKRADALALIDEVAQENDVIEALKELTGTQDEILHSFRQISLVNYMKNCGIAVEPELDASAFNFNTFVSANNVPAGEDVPALGLLVVEGEIVNDSDDPRDVSGEKYSALIRQMRNDDSIKVVVMRVNSPGGSVYAAEKMRHELALLAKEKPLYVSFGDVAASGGYWISTPAQKIYASPHTLTGSIGVFGILPNFQTLTQKIGVNTLTLKTAPYADINSALRPKTDAELAIIQKSVDEIYEQFITLVANSRKLPRERVLEIAQGRVWTGADALKIGLIDDVKDLELIVAELFSQYNLSTTKTFPQNQNALQELFDILMSEEQIPEKPFAKMARLAAEKSIKNAFPQQLETVYETSKTTLKSFDDPNNIYARLPWVEVK